MNTQTTHILLIEDNPGDIRLIAEFLKDVNNFPFELHSEKRLSDGLDYLAKGITDVVLLDLSLPDSQGYDTFAKTIACAPQTPIVMLTVLADDALAIKAVQAGAQDYLNKGQISGDLLVRTIRYAIERKQAEQVLAESENKFRWLFEYAPTAYHILTPDGIIKDVNHRWCQVLGYSKKKVLGKEIFDFIVEEERKVARGSFINKKAGKQTFVEGSECNYLTKAGAVRTFKTFDFLVVDQSQNITSIQTTLEDITERKQMETALRDSEAELKALFASMKDLVIIYNKEGRYLQIATTSAQLLIKPPVALLGKTNHEIFPKEEADRFLHHITTVLESQRTLHIEYSLEIDHRKVWFDASVSPLNKDTVIWVARDITDRKLMEEESHFIGIHDSLTKLYNRTFYEEELSRLEKSRLFPVSVIMLDVDDLKVINDTQGHAAGDELLQRTARVLLKSFRPEDMVARIGGDEFVVLLPRTNAEIAQSAIKRISHFLELNNKNTPNELKISIGVATCENQGSLVNTVKQADDRMYQDKRSKG